MRRNSAVETLLTSILMFLLNVAGEPGPLQSAHVPEPANLELPADGIALVVFEGGEAMHLEHSGHWVTTRLLHS